jgi:general secretion pathway protein G
MVETALNLIMAENPSASIDSWKELLKSSPMVKDPEQIVRDGWGREYTVTLEHGNVKVTSPGLTEYENRKSGGRPSGASSAIGS